MAARRQNLAVVNTLKRGLIIKAIASITIKEYARIERAVN